LVDGVLFCHHKGNNSGTTYNLGIKVRKCGSSLFYTFIWLFPTFFGTL